jgi:pimeloyl-ACP methyl ester carboxylesterase
LLIARKVEDKQKFEIIGFFVILTLMRICGEIRKMITETQTGEPGTVRQRRVRVGDMVLGCRLAGAGPAVLLLHGWPQTGHAWRHVVRLLSDRFTLVVPDLPGFGTSSKPPGGYDKLTVARSLVQLMGQLGHDRYHVVGHDLGGQVAYPVAALAPDQVRSVTFVEAGIPGLGDKDDAANPWRGGSWHFGFNMVHDLPEALVAGREEAYLRHLFFRDSIGLCVTDAIGPDDLAHYVAALAQPGGLRGSFGHYRALLQDRSDNRALAATPLAPPALVVGADHGIMLGWRDTVEAAFAGAVHGVLIPDSGHYLPEEQPEALVAALDTFWTGETTPC